MRAEKSSRPAGNGTAQKSSNVVGAGSTPILPHGLDTSVDGIMRVYRSGVDYGHRQGHQAGYTEGYAAGEKYARLSDESFIDAVARRVRVYEHNEGHIRQSIADTLSMMSAQQYRRQQILDAEAGDRQ